MGDVIEFRPARAPEQIATDHVQPEITDRYVGQFVPDIIDLYGELGAHESYLGILGRQLADTRLGIREGWKSSALSFEMVPDKEGGHHERRLNVAPRELVEYKKSMQGALALHQLLGRLTAGGIEERAAEKSVATAVLTESPDEARDKLLTKLAMDWILFEFSADMFSYSYAMQRRFDRYVPDYGTVASDRDYLAIADHFLQEYADVSDSHAYDNAARGEYASFRQGVALELLKQDLVRRGIVSSMQHASWVTHYLSVHYPNTRQNSIAVEPQSRQELTQRISELMPRRGMAEYYSAYFVVNEIDEEADD